MEYRGYNDYELLYMINDCFSDYALDIMIKKYEGLIVNKIKSFYFKYYQIDDLVMEGNMVLLKAIRLYDDRYNKTFTKFFEMLLMNRLIDLYKLDKKERSIEYLNDFELISNISDDSYLAEDVKINYHDLDVKDLLSSFEYDIYELFFIQNKDIKDISNILNKDNIQVSNTVQRVKKKLRVYFGKYYN